MIFSDTTGSFNNDWLGDVGIETKRPDANGYTNNYTPSAGSNYECVDDTYTDEADYVYNGITDNIDRYQLDDLSGDPTILAVEVVAFMNKDNMGGRSGILFTGREGSATLYNEETFNLSDTPTIYTDVHQIDPAAGSAWTQTNFNITELGIKTGAAS